MKDIYRNLGLVSIIVGVIILSLAVFNENQTNSKLTVSLILIVIGFLGHIILSRILK